MALFGLSLVGNGWCLGHPQKQGDAVLSSTGTGFLVKSQLSSFCPKAVVLVPLKELYIRSSLVTVNVRVTKGPLRVDIGDVLPDRSPTSINFMESIECSSFQSNASARIRDTKRSSWKDLWVTQSPIEVSLSRKPATPYP